MRTGHSLGPVAVATLLTLTACGGGGGDSSTPPAPPPASGVGIAGTAATGAAIAGGAVSVTCTSGSGQATTAANGSYSVTITSGVAPCLVQVTTSGASPITYYSMVAAGSANPSTVNITPLTTLMTAQVLGVDPATAVFGNVQGRITAANIATARTDLSAGLSGRVDLTGTDPIATAFVPGDATDQKLDQLQATLTAARVTLPELSTALIANAGAPYAIRTYLGPAAAGCTGLRSAQVAFVSPFGFDTSTLDAVTLTSVSSTGVVNTLTDNGNCNYSTQGGVGTALVAPSSVAMNRYPTGVAGQFSMSFGFPLQTVPVADLAGTWNYVGYARDPSVGGSVLTPEHGTLTLNAAGVNTAITGCTGLNTCASGPGEFTLTPNAQGGFSMSGSGVSPTSRTFAYRAPSGTMMLFFSATDADNTGFYVATKQVRTPLPTVGQVTPFSQFTIGSSGSAGAVTTNATTVTAVDASGSGSFTRTLLDGHAETILLNNPRDGMRHRMAGSSPGSNGTPVAFNAVVQMQPPGVGLTVSVSSDPAQNFFNTAIFDSTP